MEVKRNLSNTVLYLRSPMNKLHSLDMTSEELVEQEAVHYLPHRHHLQLGVILTFQPTVRGLPTSENFHTIHAHANPSSSCNYHNMS
jgi:hypothetical protein